jgi:hypothetical protein
VLPGGGGDTTSVEGTSPASAVAESAHASATAITNRFMVFSFEFEDARLLVTKTE